MGDFLVENAGQLKEEVANTTSAGSADANKLIKLNGDGKLDESLFPDGLGDDVAAKTASETIPANSLINLHSVAGATRIRLADATDASKPTHGFVKDGVAINAAGNVFFEGTIGGFTGLTPGADQFLDTTPGGVTETAPQVAGNIVQFLGVACSDTEINFEKARPIELC